MKKLSAPRAVFFALICCVALGNSTAAFSAHKIKPRGPLADSVPAEIGNNAQIQPYMPQSNLIQIYESRSSCDFNGKHIHTATINAETDYNCVDYRSNNDQWRVVFGPGSEHTRIARKVFKKDHGDWIFLAEFNTYSRLASESPSGTKVRIASGGSQEQSAPQQANENQNSSPLQGIIPNNIGGIPIGGLINKLSK